MINVFVIGAGKFAIDCIKILLLHPKINIYYVIDVSDTHELSASLLQFCTKKSIPCNRSKQPNSKNNLDKIKSGRPKYGFSLNNFNILRPTLLEIPSIGLINFHNGPLPLYGGVNVCSWAIINQEESYGVTWHYMDDKIDTGDIIAQKLFRLEQYWTVIDLTRQCIKNGVALFKAMISDLVTDKIIVNSQNNLVSSYYSLSMFPNKGAIDCRWDFKKIDAFVRGLNFSPFPNTFVHASITIVNTTLIILKVEKIKCNQNTMEPGLICSIDNNELVISCGDGFLCIVEAMDKNLQQINFADLIQQNKILIGMRIDSP